MHKFWKRPQAALLAVALVAGLGGAGLATAGRLASQRPALELRLAHPEERSTRAGFAPVVKRVLPTVVSISSSKVSKMPAGFMGPDSDDP
ncbi:MAG TPA: hypothetical protein VG672_15145, partial [Bryobacteraceae bacterium]|nr:hypothetical protein [Bryobacteraceae bacterium]